MSRGRGRGRFGGGGYGGFGKQEPFVLFPEIELPARRTVDSKDERTLIIMRSNLQKYWRASPYYLEETGPSVTGQISDIERYCDRGKPKIRHGRGSFMQFLEADTSNFPKELVADSRDDRRKRQKVQWNLDAGLQKLDMFEKQEKNYQENGENEKKEGEEEDKDDESELGDGEGSQSDDGDYEQNVDFDDDEDDYNMADDNDGDDGPVY